MKNYLFTVAKHMITIIKIILYFSITIMIIGLGALFLNRQVITMLTTNQIDLTIPKRPFIYYPIILSIAILVLFVFIYLLSQVQLLLDQFYEEDYFNQKSIEIFNKILFALICWTGLQCLALSLNTFLNLQKVSMVFNFSLKDYIINIIFFAITYIAKLILKRGVELKEDNDTIV